MEPENGDKNIHVTRRVVTEAARAVGIVLGDVMIFHSSLSSMGTVDRGPNTLIDGLLDAVGPEGTVAVPTLCNWKQGEQHLVFPTWNPATSPSYVGKITEVFRARPDAVRSDQATHSVAAIGKRAVELTADHGAYGQRPGPYSERAFAEASPWQRLYDWNGAYCFIGVTFRVCTMVHFVETQLMLRALDRVAPDKRAAALEEVEGWMKPGAWLNIINAERETLEKHLADHGKAHYAKLGSATFRMARARDLVDEWIPLVEAEPAKWIAPKAVEWLAKIGA